MRPYLVATLSSLALLSLALTSLALVSLALGGCHPEFTLPPSAGDFPVAMTPDWAHQARYAITDNLSDTLSFVTAGKAMPELLANVVVGDNPVELEGPHHIASSPDGASLYFNLSNYVPGTGSGPHGSHGLGNVPGSLVKLDAYTTVKVGEAPIDRSPGDVILSADGALAYVTHYDVLKLQQAIAEGKTEEAAYSSLAIIDTATMTRVSMTPLCVTSHGEGLSADGKTLYAVCALADQMVVVDVSDPVHPKVTLRLPVGPEAAAFGSPPTYGPYALAVSPSEGTVWISDNNSGDVRVFDPKTMQMDAQRTVLVGGVAVFGSFTHDGKTFYVPHQGDNKVTAIDTDTLATRDLSLPPSACLNPHLVTLTPDEKSALVICEGDHVKTLGSALFISLSAWAITGYVQTNLFSDGAAWLPPAQ